MTWQIVGHNHAVRQLKAGLKSERLSHAYLFVGPSHVGKSTLALNLAQAVNCVSSSERPCGQCSQCRRIASGLHPDFQVINPLQADGSRPGILMEDIRAAEHRIHLTPYEGSYRVFIFDGAENMSKEVSNALLKTLEEPPPRSLLILLATKDTDVLPTIISRCQRISLRPLPQDDVLNYLSANYSEDETKAQIIARLSRGRLGWALLALRDPSILERRGIELDRIIKLIDASVEHRFNAAADLASLFYTDRQATEEVLEEWLFWWRDLLMVRQGAESSVYNFDYMDVLRDQASRCSLKEIADFVNNILQLLVELNHNANPNLALEVLMLSMPNQNLVTQASQSPMG